MSGAISAHDVNGSYQPRSIKRRRRSAKEVDLLERQILAVLEDDHPQSIRHVFYRMTDPRLPEPVEKSEDGYKQVQSRITLLRRAGRLPYGWISDATRYGYFTSTYGSAAEFIRSHASAYRADLWADADTHVEVWCESRSIAGVIVDDCRELAVSLYPAGGFSSISFAFEAAEFLNAQVRASGKPIVIFYIGDYDPAGVLIDRSIENELRRHLMAGAKLDFIRIAIAPEQIEEYDLPTKARKKLDRRALHITGTVEAEAMPAGILRQLLRTQIESHLPERALEVALIAEEAEMASLRFWADLIGKAGR